jgi:hypothetical protein
MARFGGLNTKNCARANTSRSREDLRATD